VLQYHFNWKTPSAMAGVTWWNFYFRLFLGAIKNPQVVEFLRHLMRHLPGKLRDHLRRPAQSSQPLGVGPHQIDSHRCSKFSSDEIFSRDRFLVAFARSKAGMKLRHAAARIALTSQLAPFREGAPSSARRGRYPSGAPPPTEPA
jgi:hypothetical protein